MIGTTKWFDIIRNQTIFFIFGNTKFSNPEPLDVQSYYQLVEKLLYLLYSLSVSIFIMELWNSLFLNLLSISTFPITRHNGELLHTWRKLEFLGILISEHWGELFEGIQSKLAVNWRIGTTRSGGTTFLANRTWHHSMITLWRKERKEF